MAGQNELKNIVNTYGQPGGYIDLKNSIFLFIKNLNFQIFFLYGQHYAIELGLLIILKTIVFCFGFRSFSETIVSFS